MSENLENSNTAILRTIRHDLSAAISCLESGIDHIRRKTPGTERALELHSMGMEKLNILLAKLDEHIAPRSS